MSTYYFDNNTILKASAEQDKFILSNNKFIILNSCAGSGKTRCLILKIKHLIDKLKIKKSDLIICTYTKAMTNTLKSRINFHFDNYLKTALIGTFHSICYQLIKPIMFETKSEQTKSEQTNAQQIEIASHEEILVYAYENILNNNINISSKYFIIDEYQDLSPMQQKIIYHLLAYGKIKGLFLIGDKNQSIYTYYNNQTIESWLDKVKNLSIGSLKKTTKSETTDAKELLFQKLGISILDSNISIETIDNNIFTKSEQPITEQPITEQPITEQLTTDSFIDLSLTQNFRSTKDIINLANCFISEEDSMSSIYTYDKYKPKLIIFDKWIEEINYLCKTILSYVEKNRFKTLGTIAILSRYNKTLEFIEDKLINMDIGCNYIKYNNKINPNCVNLCTIHSSKGLEFDNVFFVNSSYNTNPLDDFIHAEECRLFYVAITRSKKQLVITSNKNINDLIISKVSDVGKMDLFDFSDRRQDKQSTLTKKIFKSKEDKLIEEINTSNIRDRCKTWIGVTELIKLLGGEHIIYIKKILSPIMSFKPTKKQVHEPLINSVNKSIPKCFSEIKIMSNTNNVFGLFIDAMVSRHIQFLKNEKIQYQDLNKLVLLYYLNDKTDISELNQTQIAQLKNLYNMNDAIFKSNILLDRTDYNIPKINNVFEKTLRESYLKFINPDSSTIDILYDIFVCSLTNPIINERSAYQHLPQYIKSTDLNSNQYLLWYQNVLAYVDNLVKYNQSIQTQVELTNHYLKIIGFADIVIPFSETIIDVKTSIYEFPKLEYLLQIIIYGLLNQTPINKYQIYNPIYGILYEWTFKDDRTNHKYIEDIKNKLIDYLSRIMIEINNKRSYNL